MWHGLRFSALRIKKENNNRSAGQALLIHRKCRQQEAIFPAAFINPVSKIPEVDHN